MDSVEAKILKDLGWSDEFMIPVANDENKKLASEIRTLIQKKAELTIKISDQDLKRKHVKKAISSAIDGINHNKELINSLQNQLNSENETCLRQKSEITHFETLMKQLKKKKAHINDRCQMLAFEQSKYKAKIDKQKALIDWAESILQEINCELDREDNVLDLMEKYQMHDRDQFKEDELKRQKLLRDLKTAENILQTEVQELKAKEVEYEQIVKMCRNFNKERNGLIDQWEYSMKMFKLREADICLIEKQIESLESKVGLETLRLEEEKKNYEEEKRTNQERALKRQYFFEQSNVLRTSLQELETRLSQLKHEKKFLRTRVLELENEKQLTKTRIRELQCQLQKKSQRLVHLKQKQQDLKKKLNDIDSEVKSSDETVKQLNCLLKLEQCSASTLHKEIEKLSRQWCTKTLEVNMLKREYETLTSEKEANVSKMYQLLKEESKTLELLARQGETLHRHDFHFESVQKKVWDIRASHSGQYAKAKNEELEALMEKKKDIEKCFDVTRRENKTIDVAIARTVLQIKKDRNSVEELRNSLATAKIMAEGKGKLLKATEDKIETLSVDENLLLLKLQQLKNQMEQHANQVYSLEKTRIEMESSIQARKAEIDSNKAILLTRKRTLQEIRSNLKRSLDHLTVRIDQLKNRYEVIVYNIEGQVFSCVSFTIQNIQDKHVLLEQGNQLESDIIKAEKEIIALENTVQVVTSSNISYKSAVFQVEEQNSDLEQDLSKQLDQELCALEEIQSEVNQLATDIQTLEENLAWMIDNENQLTKQWNEKDNKVQQLGVELNQQTTKLIRAEKQIKQLKKTLDLVGHEKQGLIQLAEKDLCTKELIECNESALQQLAELSVRNPETAPIISQYLNEAKLSLPLRHSPATSVLSTPDVMSVRSYASSSRLGDGEASKLGGQWRAKSSTSPFPSNGKCTKQQPGQRPSSETK